MTKRSIQSLGAQEVDVTVIPADLFRQDLSNPADPILDFQDRAIRARRLESPKILATERVETPLVEAETLVSTAPTGTTPLILTSTTKVNNLNADLHDGYHAGNASGNVPISNGTVNTNLIAEKAVKQTLSTVSANTALDSDACIIEVTTANAVTLTIPSGLPVGHQYRLKRTVSSANDISVVTSGSETIEGSTSFTAQGSKVSATLDTGEVVLEKVSSTAWAFVGGQVSGSNTNGSWIKFSDGTMIVYIPNKTLSGLSWWLHDSNIGAYGWSFYEASPTIPFPVEFIDTNYAASVRIRNPSSMKIVTSLASWYSTISLKIEINSDSNIYTTAIVDCIIIGRWKS